MALTLTFLPAEDLKPIYLLEFKGLDALVLDGASEPQALLLAHVYPVWTQYAKQYVFDLGFSPVPLAQREKDIKEVIFGEYSGWPLWEEPVLYRRQTENVDEQGLEELMASLISQ